MNLKMDWLKLQMEMSLFILVRMEKVGKNNAILLINS